MASNYVQLNWYEPSWDDDQVGALSSLERRQRKAAEKQDVLAFYSSLGFLFFIITGLLVWSEIYAFATAPSRALTGAFLLEVWRSAGVAYSQLQILYKHVGELAWIWNAVVYGHDFAQRGVNITHGAAKLLASGLYYHAVILSGMLMYRTYPHVIHAPVRTALLSTLSAGILFGTPPLYASLTSHFCQNCGPEPVVLLALLLAGLMCFAALYMSSSISGRLAGAGATAAAAARQRLQAARRPGGAAAAAGGGHPGQAPLGGGAVGGGGAGPGGSKRNSSVAPGTAAANHAFGRISSLGRSAGGACGGGFGLGAATGGDWVHGCVGASSRSGSSSSLCSPTSCANSGFGCLATDAAAAAAGGDPVGPLSSSARSLSGLASGGSSSVDLTVPCTELKAGVLSGGSRNRGAGSGGAQPAAKPSCSHDPVVANQRTGQRGGGGGSGCNNTHSGSSDSSSAASIPKDNRQQQQQQQQQHGRQGSGGVCGAIGDGLSGSGAGKGKSQSTSARMTARDPTTATAAAAGSSTRTSCGGGGSGKNAAATAAASKANIVPDPVAAPAPLKKKAPTGSNASSSSASGPAAATGAGAGRHSTNAAVGNSACAATSNRFRSDTTSLKAGAGALGAGALGACGGKGASPSLVTPATVSTKQTSAATDPAAAATAAVASSSPGATAPAATTAAGSGGGLLARITATVTSAANVAPVLSGRGAKKATAGASRKQPGQQAAQQPQPQYVIVPPPPPPPRKLAGGACEAQSHSTTAAASANGSPTASASQPVRNAWLSPNPVIKLAAGMAKGPKGPVATAAAGRSAAPHLSPAAIPGATSATRSTGGGAPPGNAPPPPPARSASCGGGVTSSDPRVLATRSCEVAAAACNDPVSPPPPPISSPTAAVGDPVSLSLGHGQVMPRQLRASGGGGHPAAESVVSATVFATDPSVGPLVVHKHASGDLDIASAAANYLPYPSTTLTPAVLPAVPPYADVDSDSFSFFSIPPPAISDAGPDPGAPPGAPDSDAAPYNLAHALCGMYGGNNFASLSSFAADPVWSPNVPTALFPPAPPGLAAAAARASRVPPPGFPSHAYGGAFASGPFPAAAWSHPQPPNPPSIAVVGAIGPTDAAGQDVPPLPPANDSGVLASLGFVDEAADSNSGGGEDGAGSCAICWSAPRQVGFLHGKTSHLCVCRKCAAQLREGVHRCPMCRQLIERIIDIF